MEASARQEAAEARSVEQEATVKAATVWVHQLARTLKNCRLYEANNPTVAKFRQDLATGLQRLLDEFGELTFRFTSDDVLLDEASLHPAKSRDDNLALPFFRDGVRGLSLSPGITPAEVDALLNAILQVTGQNDGDNDLVTLLWESQLPHVNVDYVPADSEIGTADLQEEAAPIPWPDASEVQIEAQPAADAGTETTEAQQAEAKQSRSDDWNTTDQTAEIEAAFEELHFLAPTETDRFRRTFEAEHSVSHVTTALAIARAYLSASPTAVDREELATFVQRLLRLSVSRGSWIEASEALGLLKQCESMDWVQSSFCQELMQPISISGIVQQLDGRPAQQVQEFILFARGLGEPAADVLTLVLSESEARLNRRLIAEVIAELCRGNPERLAPWLAVRRWFVVRNVVHILGWVGGEPIVGMLQGVTRHPEPRVRQEVVTALSRVDIKLARPLLLKMLDRGDPRLFSAVLHQLSAERHPPNARLVLGYLQDPGFDHCPTEEKRAIYSALGACGTDEIVPELEAELFKTGWFSRNQEHHRQALARCLARIGTPQARSVIERGSTSRRPAIRLACEAVLMGAIGDHE